MSPRFLPPFESRPPVEHEPRASGGRRPPREPQSRASGGRRPPLDARPSRARVLTVLAGFGLAALGLALPAGALAAAREPSSLSVHQSGESVQAELLVLHGTNDGKGIDPKLPKMPELSRPPFSAYNTYTLLNKAQLELVKTKSATYKLPNGSTLQVTLKDVASKKGEPTKYVVDTSIQGGKQAHTATFNAKGGQMFFLAGQDYKGGILVLGFKLPP